MSANALKIRSQKWGRIWTILRNWEVPFCGGTFEGNRPRNLRPKMSLNFGKFGFYYREILRTGPVLGGYFWGHLPSKINAQNGQGLKPPKVRFSETHSFFDDALRKRTAIWMISFEGNCPQNWERFTPLFA